MRCVAGFNVPCEECYYKPCIDMFDDSFVEDEQEICDYTGELCFGDKMFCEECEVMYEGDEKK